MTAEDRMERALWTIIGAGVVLGFVIGFLGWAILRLVGLV